MYENDGGLLSPRDAYRLMLKDYPDVMDIVQMCEVRTPLCKISSTGEIEQRFRLN